MFVKQHTSLLLDFIQNEQSLVNTFPFSSRPRQRSIFYRFQPIFKKTRI